MKAETEIMKANGNIEQASVNENGGESQPSSAVSHEEIREMKRRK